MMPNLTTLLRDLLSRSLGLAALAALLAVAAACGSGDAPSGQPTVGGAPVVGATADSATPAATATTRPAVSRGAGPKLEIEEPFFWLNSDPLTIKALSESNKVVLIDFWTYTCVNCLRTLPFLKDWHAKYKDRGLVIVGVHTPEFEFEKLPVNVRKAIVDHGIGWAVVQDNEYATWRSFGNQYWPAKYLIGVDGNVRFTHFGEGQYVETEEEVRAALKDAGYAVDDIPLGTVNEQERVDKAPTVTRELYGGYDRNYGFGGQYAGQEQYYLAPDQAMFYEDKGGGYGNNKFYLQGLWKNELDAIVHVRDTPTPEDYIALRFAAASVNAVIHPRTQDPFTVVLELDGKPLTPEQAGLDVTFDAEGRSVLAVNGEARLYSVVRLSEYGIHDLKLATTSSRFALAAFTFGIYKTGI